MRLLSVNEVASRLGLSPLTVRRLIRQGKLPYVRPTPRTIRVPESAVIALAMGTAPATPTTEGA
jgi:excisionase family DNA binding protein